MKAIYLDCFSGISGNMLLGAFLQAGVPRDFLKKELSRLPINGEFIWEDSLVDRCGIYATHVKIRLKGQETAHGEGHEHAHHHDHRSFADIRRLLEASSLAEPVKEKALAIFEVLAKAEGKIHGKPYEEVTFHEVGAVDSIVDIVGTSLALDYLAIEKIFVSAVNTGTGTVECAHGTMPVPAPATAELLLGFQSYHTGTRRELATPTGAAVLKALGAPAMSLPREFSPERIAYGAGSAELSTPNVLRMYVGTYEGRGSSPLCLLEANIDDMNPQVYGYLYDRLLSAGALDVWTTPIYMKKNRPAATLSILCAMEKKEELAGIVFSESTSIGLRVIPVDSRLEANRRTATIETKYGTVRCKISAWAGSIVSISAEYEDCRRLAEKGGVPLKEIQFEAVREMRTRLGD